jgi:hypothetical protein
MRMKPTTIAVILAAFLTPTAAGQLDLGDQLNALPAQSPTPMHLPGVNLPVNVLMDDLLGPLFSTQNDQAIGNPDCIVTSVYAAEVQAFLEGAGIEAIRTGPTTVLAQDGQAPFDGPIASIPVPSSTECLELGVAASSFLQANVYDCHGWVNGVTVVEGLIRICARAESYLGFASYSLCGVTQPDPITATHHCLGLTEKGRGEAQLTAADVDLFPDSNSAYACSIPLTTSLASCSRTYPVHYALHQKTLRADHYMVTRTEAAGLTAPLFLQGDFVLVTANSRYTP